MKEFDARFVKPIKAKTTEFEMALVLDMILG